MDAGKQIDDMDIDIGSLDFATMDADQLQALAQKYIDSFISSQELCEKALKRKRENEIFDDFLAEMPGKRIKQEFPEPAYILQEDFPLAAPIIAIDENKTYHKLLREYNLDQQMFVAENCVAYPITSNYNPKKARNYGNNKENFDRSVGGVASEQSRSKTKDRFQKMAYEVEFSSARNQELFSEQQFMIETIQEIEKNLLKKGYTKEQILVLRSNYGIY